MNILFLTSTLPRFAGDQQAGFVLEQAAAWRRARPDDRLFILAPHDTGAARAETIDGIGIHRFRYMRPERLQSLAYPAILPNLRRNPLRALLLPGFLIAQYRAARALIARHDIGLVYAHWVMPQGLVARRLRRRVGVPYVLQNHSSDLAVFARAGAPGRALARGVLRDAAAFFCVNSRQRDFARTLLPTLACNVLPMGVPPGLPPHDPGAAARYDLGTISRLSRKKGIDHLIAATETLARNGHGIRLGIAGDGEDAETLRNLPDQADIHFTGFLTGPAKADFFRDCRAMAFPSVSAGGDVEGLPVALLEALVAGKPVIASRDTNIELLEEWPQIRDHVSLLDNPADRQAFAQAIARVTTQPAQADALRAVMGRYGWDRLIGEYLAVISAALSADAAPDQQPRAG